MTIATIAVADKPGRPDVLTLREGPAPVPGAREVLIAVEATGVASGDLQARQGMFATRFPYTPGYDAVGHVSAVGPEVGGHQVGMRVAAYTGVGGNASQAIARAELCVPVPDGLPAERVCALVLNYTTAWQLLHRAARVPAGGTVLVLGATGGVGSALTELALADGLTVWGTASAAKHAVLSAQGVRAVVTSADVTEPVDVTFDGVGGPSLARSQRVTKRSGTVVMYGVLGTAGQGASRTRVMGAALLALIRAKLRPGARVTTFSISSTTDKDPGSFRTDLAHLIELLRQGRLHPEITVLPLAAIADAHRRLEARRVLGKIVLLP